MKLWKLLKLPNRLKKTKTFKKQEELFKALKNGNETIIFWELILFKIFSWSVFILILYYSLASPAKKEAVSGRDKMHELERDIVYYTFPK